MRIQLGSSQHEVSQVGILTIGACSTGRLNNHRAIRLVGSLHDGLDLLHVVDVKSSYPVIMFRSVIKQDAKGN
jgi:hypothetical protein